METQNKNSRQLMKKRRRIRLGNRRQMSMPVEADIVVENAEEEKDGK